MKIKQKSDKWLGIIWLMLGLAALFFLITGQASFSLWCVFGILLSILIYELVKRYGKRNIS